MSDRYIPGVPCWIDTTQPDPAAAATFYGALFGWEFENVAPPQAPGPYLIARLPGGDVAAVGWQREGAPANAAWNTYVWVADADETAAKVRAAGGGIIVEPGDVGENGRSGVFTDTSGARFLVWEAKGHRGATVVNEPGSLNFNTLETPDVEGAQAFYGAVFGWELIDTGGPMWALPAYGDFLEERTPGTRERMAEMGAPARFQEVVASVMPAADGPASWGVTFGVADADAIAARAAELGGTVITAPFDAPWVRMAVIADPQGATFTASQFVPPEATEVASSAGGASAAA